MTSEAAIDAGLALFVVVVVVVAIGITGAGVSTGGVVSGAVATVVVEVVAGRWTDRIRGVWEQPTVRVGAVVVAVGFVGVVAAVLPSFGLSFLAGALGVYLIVLAAATTWGAVIERR